jgi:hypothetical protein
MLIAAETNPVAYLPIGTTLVAAAFTMVLWRHWNRNRQARHVMWWLIGVAMFGIGTATEALTTLFGWQEPLFRAWYISGALLGGAPLAQGTVYLVMARDRADRLTASMITYVTLAAMFVVLTPIDTAAVDPTRLESKVMEWGWVRLFSPLLNTYALVFLVGGAAWSAWRYRRSGIDARSRVRGNVLIAIGALLPGIGGSFTRAGYVEVLYVTELVGLSLIWLGYRAMVADTAPSIHRVQARPHLAVDEPLAS